MQITLKAVQIIIQPRCHDVGAVGGNKDVASILLRHGADVNLRDKDGKTILMMAVINGHQALVELLLDNKADITAQNEVSVGSVCLKESKAPYGAYNTNITRCPRNLVAKTNKYLTPVAKAN